MALTHPRALQKCVTIVTIVLIVIVASVIPVSSQVETGNWRPVLRTDTLVEGQSAGSTGAQNNNAMSKNREPCGARAAIGQGVNCTRGPSAQRNGYHEAQTVLTVTVGDLASFYETVITILGIALAIVAGLAYWSVRMISRSTAEDIALDAIKKIISDSKSFSASIDEFIKKYTNNRMEEIEDSLEEFSERIDAIERELASQDKAEEIKGDIEKVERE